MSSIRSKIILPYALLTLILAVFGAYVVTRLVTGSFEARFKNQLLEAGRIVSNEVVKHESSRLQLQRAVAFTEQVPQTIIDRDINRLETLITPVVANDKNIDSVIVVDTQGRELLRLQRDSLAENAPLQIFPDSGADFRAWTAVNNVLSDPRGITKETILAKTPDTNQYIVYTIGSVRTPEDPAIVGAVLVGTYLQKELQTLRSLALADITFLNEEGHVLATTFPLDEAETEQVFSYFTPARYQQVVNQLEVTLLDEIEGPTEIETPSQRYRLAYGPYIPRDKIFGVYAVALPTNFITDTNDQSRNRLAIIFALGVVGVFGIGYVISQRIIHPIIRLVQTSQAIAQGDLERQTGLKREDEIGFLAETFDNMTAELRRLLRLQEEEASKLNAILNSIADGVVMLNPDGEIMIMNPAAQDLLKSVEEGLDYSQLRGLEMGNGQSTNGGESSRLLTSLTGLSFHEAHRFEVGRRFFSALSAPVYAPDGERLGSVVVLRDITREVESEKLKDDFIQSVSHELKTPLTAVIGYNNLLKMMIASNVDNGQLTAIIDKLDKEASDLDNLIQGMLDLSQIDAGTLGIDQEPVNLSELIEMKAEQWADKMEAKELTFSYDIGPEPLWVEGDEERLGQVLNHLIKNAHDYTLPGGQVRVALKQVDNQAQVDVEDTGVGIAPEDIPFLFSRFFRAIHEKSTYEISGAGLGLYISKAIIETHNGQIWVETEPNQGSAFSFALPLLESETEDTVDYLGAE